MSDLINKFIADGAEQELIDVNLLLKDLVTSLKSVHAENKGIDIKVSGSENVAALVNIRKEQEQTKKSVSELSLAMDQYNKQLTAAAISEAKLAAADSDAAKSAMAAKVALEEKNKELKKSAQLENEAFLARQKNSGTTPAQSRSLEIAERNELLAIERELARIAKEEAAAKAANFASSAQFQAEAKALYDIVKAHNEAAAALRAEAAEKTKLALQSTDAAERTRLEAAATDALTNAQKEERSVKEALANANKQVAATVRDNVLAENALIAAKAQLEAKAASEIAAAARQENAYEKLKREYNEAAYAVKTLAAEYVNLKNSGRASVEELEKLSKELKAQQEATLQQSNALLQMEQAVGQNQRAVGNYANATGEINQILRELPNFAISTQTGILSLSNNLPMLQTALSRLAQTVDVNTGAAIGWRGVLKTLGSSIFSLQGLIVLGTTLLVAYGKDIWNAINPTTALQRATEAYNKSLETQLETISKEVGSLKTLQYALNDTTRSTEERKVALDRLNAAYPGYFNNLSAEVSDIGNVNAQIEKQIELLTAQAKAKASEEAVGSAVDEMLKAQSELNKSSGIGTELWARIRNDLRFLSDGYDKASDSTKKLIDEQLKLYQSGEINRNQFTVQRARLLDLDAAQKGLNETIRLAADPMYKQVKATEEKIQSHLKEIRALQNEIDKEKEAIRVYGEGVNHTKDYIANKERQIDVLNRSITAMSGEIAKIHELTDLEARKRTLTMRSVSDDELAVMRAENNANKVKKGTKEREVLDRKVLDAQFEVNKKKLQNEYRTQKGLEAMRVDDLEKNQEYLTRLENMRLKLYDKTDNKKDKAAKKEAKIFDPTKEILAANQREFAANQEFDKSQLEATNAHLENIFNVETNSLQKRLNAYEQYVENLKAISEIDYNTSITEKQKQLDAILAIEKKYGVEITKENREEFVKRKDLSQDERTLLLEKFAVMQELSLASAKQAEVTLKMNENAQKKERDIRENNDKYLVRSLNERYAAVRDNTSKEVSFRLAKLEELRSKGEIGDREFFRKRQMVLADESKLLFQNEYKMLQEEYQKIIADPTIPDAVKKALEKLSGDLEKVRPEPKKTERRSLFDLLGFGSRDSNEFDNSLKTLNKSKFEMDNAIAQYAVSEAYWAEQLNNAKSEAAQLFGVGTDGYAKAVAEATQKQTEGLKNAQTSVSLFSRDYELEVQNAAEAAAKVTENLKQSIANSLKGLYDTLFNAVDQSRENYFNERFNQLDKERDDIQRNADLEKAAIESSLMNNEQKQRELAAIDGRRLAEEKKKEQERRALQRQQAQREKEDAIFKISMEGGIAAAKALSGAAANPALAIAAAALIAAQTIANIALIRSRPIPEYWKGTDNHPGGLAVVGDRYGVERVELPSGKTFFTPPTATVMDLPAGAKVVSNKDLANEASVAAMKEMGKAGSPVTPDMYAQSMAINFEQGMAMLGNRFEEGIKKIPINKFYWDDGQLKRSQERSNGSIKFLNGFKGWSN